MKNAPDRNLYIPIPVMCKFIPPVREIIAESQARISFDGMRTKFETVGGIVHRRENDMINTNKSIKHKIKE